MTIIKIQICLSCRYTQGNIAIAALLSFIDISSVFSIQNGHHFEMRAENDRFYYYVVSNSTVKYHLAHENSKNQKVENDQNSKWSPF